MGLRTCSGRGRFLSLISSSSFFAISAAAVRALASWPFGFESLLSAGARSHSPRGSALLQPPPLDADGFTPDDGVASSPVSTGSEVFFSLVAPTARPPGVSAAAPPPSTCLASEGV